MRAPRLCQGRPSLAIMDGLHHPSGQVSRIGAESRSLAAYVRLQPAPLLPPARSQTENVKPSLCPFPSPFLPCPPSGCPMGASVSTMLLYHPSLHTPSIQLIFSIHRYTHLSIHPLIQRQVFCVNRGPEVDFMTSAPTNSRRFIPRPGSLSAPTLASATLDCGSHHPLPRLANARLTTRLRHNAFLSKNWDPYSSCGFRACFFSDMKRLISLETTAVRVSIVSTNFK